MPVKHLTTEQFLGTAQFDSKVQINGTIADNGSSLGTAGQVLGKDGSNNVAWINQTGGGGGVTGTGTANTLAMWDSSSSIRDSSYLTEDGTGVIIGGGSASAKLHVKGSVKFDTDTLYNDSVNKRIGLGTITPAQLLHVNGNMRLEGVFQDGSNSSGTSGQLLSSTGTDTLWIDAPSPTVYRDIKIFSDSFKVGTSGTFFFNTTTSGSGSLGYNTLFIAPDAGKLVGLKIVSSASYSGVQFALVNQSGTALYNSGSQTLTANTVKVLTMSTTITDSTRIGIRWIRGTAGGNGDITVTAEFEWDY